MFCAFSILLWNSRLNAAYESTDERTAGFTFL